MVLRGTLSYDGDILDMSQMILLIVVSTPLEIRIIDRSLGLELKQIKKIKYNGNETKNDHYG